MKRWMYHSSAVILLAFFAHVVTVHAADTTPPTITGITRHDPSSVTTTADAVMFRVTFSEAVTGVDKADFALSGTAAVGASITAVTAQSQSVYDVAVAVPAEGQLGLVVRTALDNIADLAGNAYDDGVALAESYTVNHVPKITAITRAVPTSSTARAGQLVYRVAFSEAVNNVDASDFILSGTAAANSAITSVAAVDQKTYDVAVQASTEGVLILGVKTTTDISDGTHTFAGTIDAREDYTVIVPPTVAGIVRQVPTDAVTTADAVMFRVTFSEAVTGVDKADFALSGTAAAESAITSVTAVDQKTYDVRVTTADGTLSLALKDDASIADADRHAFVPNAGVTPETYTIGRAPVITITAKTKEATRAVDDTTVTVEDDTGIAAANVTIDAATDVAVSAFTCTQTTAKKVTCTMVVDGVGALVIRAKDASGAVATVAEHGYRISRNVDIDRPKPTKTSADKKKVKLSKKRTTYVRRTSLTFKGEVPVLAGGEVKIYDGKKKVKTAAISKTNGAWSATVKLSDGKKHKLTFKFYDRHGDKIVTKGPYKVVADKTAPKITDLPARLTKRPGQKIWWEARDNYRIKYYRYTWRGRHVKTRTPSFVVPRNTPRGTYDLEVRVYDRAHNKAVKKVMVIVR